MQNIPHVIARVNGTVVSEADNDSHVRDLEEGLRCLAKVVLNLKRIMLEFIPKVTHLKHKVSKEGIEPM